MREVKVVPHQTHWNELFHREKELLKTILPKEAIIHHIGSTSVSGLSAKPIIDILVEVSSLEEMDGMQNLFQSLGYIGKGENGIPNRRFFLKDHKNTRIVNLHIFLKDTHEVTRHLAVRDYLREHELEARKYGELKESVAKLNPHDIEGYIQGKDAYVKQLEIRALDWHEKNRSE